MRNASDIQPSRGIFVGQVISHQKLCEEHYRIIVSVKDFPTSKPGQFVQLQCRNLEVPCSLHEVEWTEGQWPRLSQSELTDQEPLLRRPFSLAGRRNRNDGRTELEIIYRTIGTGTRWLSGIEVGRPLSLLGPLGNAFGIHPDKPLAALVGGGVGIPPMMYLAEALQKAGKETVAFNGARSMAYLPLTLRRDVEVSHEAQPTRCIERFHAYDVPSVIATDDGSLGFAGWVSQAFDRWVDALGRRTDELVAYCCGPEPLMQAVAQTCIARDIPCQLAMERHMACGMGTCQSCIVTVRDDTSQGWSYKLCCTDGPIFDAQAIVWE